MTLTTSSASTRTSSLRGERRQECWASVPGWTWTGPTCCVRRHSDRQATQGIGRGSGASHALRRRSRHPSAISRPWRGEGCLVCRAANCRFCSRGCRRAAAGGDSRVAAWPGGFSGNRPCPDTPGCATCPKPNSYSFEHQDLICIFATEPIGAVDEHHLHVPLGGQVTQALEARPHEGGQRRRRLRLRPASSRWSARSGNGSRRGSLTRTRPRDGTNRPRGGL
jgi:hypothetical protein